MTANPKPVVTMDEDHYGRVWVMIDGRSVGLLNGYAVRLDGPWLCAAELRAIADSLDQLEGANLLSSVDAG